MDPPGDQGRTGSELLPHCLLLGRKAGWRELLTDEAVEDAIARRLYSLLGREKKTSAEMDEIDRLVGHHVSLKEKALKWAERQQALTARRESGDEPAAERPRRGRSGQDSGSSKGKGGKKAKNEVGHLTEADFAEWLGTLFGYQLRCREAKNDTALPRTRNILKSRQIGMTYYFAGEALEDAV